MKWTRLVNSTGEAYLRHGQRRYRLFLWYTWGGQELLGELHLYAKGEISGQCQGGLTMQQDLKLMGQDATRF